MFPENTLKKFLKIKTPFYYYDISLLRKTLVTIKRISEKYGFEIHYALKANANEKILEIIRNWGFGADCVSGNEIKQALKTGFKPQSIAFAGVGKTDDEIIYALKKNIFCFNVESLQEIEVLNSFAKKMGKTAPVALRINPGVNPNTHHYITTGLEENKFGIHKNDLAQALALFKKLKNIRLLGIHYHIGSQITGLDSFKHLCLKANEIQQFLFAHNIIVEHINVGGGLGVDYHFPDENPMVNFDSYFKVFHDFLELERTQKLHFELGRAVIAQCGTLIAKTLFVKKGLEKNFIVLDAGMTELIRPALYQAYHKIENISCKELKPLQKYDVVGPICESSDCFGKSVLLPQTKRDDLIAIRTAGAYGEVMSSAYNLREKVRAYYSATSD